MFLPRDMKVEKALCFSGRHQHQSAEIRSLQDDAVRSDEFVISAPCSTSDSDVNSAPRSFRSSAASWTWCGFRAVDGQLILRLGSGSGGGGGRSEEDGAAG